MQDFRKRRHPHRELLRAALLTVGVVAVAALAYFALRGTWGMYQKFAAASAASAAAQARLADLETRHGTVSQAVQELGTARGVEAELRQRYGVARQGEGLIMVVHQAATGSEGSAGGEGWLNRVWNALFVW